MKSLTLGTAVKLIRAPLLIFALALYFYVIAGNIQEMPMPGQLGPAFWPRVILVLLMISCGVKALELIMAERKKRIEAGDQGPSGAVNYGKLAVMIVVIVAAVFAMEFLGFLLANFLFLLIFTRIAGWQKKVSLFLISLLGTLFLLFLFVKVVYLPLPKGQWFFYDLTIFLYRLLHII